MKKIGNNDIIGERGVTAVRALVLEMGFVFYETGGVEAGIDGFIGCCHVNQIYCKFFGNLPVVISVVSMA